MDSLRIMLLAVALGAALVPVSQASVAVAAPPQPAERCEWPHPCGYEWEGAGLGPFELAEVREVHVESHDGTLLRGWLGLPALPEGVDGAPVALHSSPYLGFCHPAGVVGCVPGPGTEAFWADAPGAGVVRTWGVPPIDLVRRGYVAAFFDLRGTGGSGGCLDFGGLAEQGDQAMLVEWLAAQPWSNGRVAMGGNSYPGGTAWQAAVHAPEGLATIVPTGVITDWYTTFHSPQGAYYEKLLAVAVPFEVTTVWLPHAGAGSDLLGDLALIPQRAGCEPFRSTTEPTAGAFVVDRDPDYWEPRRYIERFDRVQASVLMPHGLWDVTGHGFQDRLVWGVLAARDDMPPMWQISGQWGHGPPFAETPALTPEWIRDNWPTILFDWLGYWLQGAGTTPPHRVDYQDSAGDWHTSGAWPPAEARDEAFFLDGDRTFRAAPSPGNDHASSSSSIGGVPVPPAWWAWCRNDTLPDALGDTAVAWVSEPFATDSLLAGNPFAYLELSADQPAGVVQVALLRWPAGAGCDDPPEVAQLVAHGAADLRYHAGGYTARPFPVATPKPVRVDVFNTAVRFHPGDRLVVAVSGPEAVGLYSSTSPWVPEVTVHASLSHIVLPFVEGGLGGDPTDIDYPPYPWDPTQRDDAGGSCPHPAAAHGCAARAAAPVNRPVG
jgi:putative CocE/NonD family hydrolase